MGMKNCPICDAMNEETNERCVGCGRLLSPTPAPPEPAASSGVSFQELSDEPPPESGSEPVVEQGPDHEFELKPFLLVRLWSKLLELFRMLKSKSQAWLQVMKNLLRQLVREIRKPVAAIGKWLGSVKNFLLRQPAKLSALKLRFNLLNSKSRTWVQGVKDLLHKLRESVKVTPEAFDKWVMRILWGIMGVCTLGILTISSVLLFRIHQSESIAPVTQSAPASAPAAKPEPEFAKPASEPPAPVTQAPAPPASKELAKELAKLEEPAIVPVPAAQAEPMAQAPAPEKPAKPSPAASEQTPAHVPILLFAKNIDRACAANLSLSPFFQKKSRGERMELCRVERERKIR